MIKIDLWSTREDPPQSFGGLFKIKQVTGLTTAMRLELEPQVEHRPSGHYEKRAWQSATVQIAFEDVPLLLTAVLAQLNQTRADVQQFVEDATGNKQARWEIYDQYEGAHDLSWEKVRSLFEASKRS
jgi:hypothetical protein